MDYIQHYGPVCRISPRDTVQQGGDVGAAAVSVWDAHRHSVCFCCLWINPSAATCCHFAPVASQGTLIKNIPSGPNGMFPIDLQYEGDICRLFVSTAQTANNNSIDQLWALIDGQHDTDY